MYPVNKDHIERIERLASVGETTTEIMHELNNCVAVITGYTAMLRAETGETSTGTSLKALMDSCEKCCRLARELLTFVRGGRPEKTKADLAGVVTRTMGIKARMFEEAGIQVRIHLPEEQMEVLANEFQLQQVVFNIVHNAHHALMRVERRMLEIRGKREGGRAMVAFRDSGPGISDEHREKIFEPFYSTKPAGEGTGLGLSISRRIAEDHGGRLYAEKGDGGGATFILDLPLADSVTGHIRSGTVCGTA